MGERVKFAYKVLYHLYILNIIKSISFSDPCHRKPHGYRYSDGQSCYGYFICFHGRSKYLTCPNGLYYNSYQKSCHPDPTCFKDNLIHRKWVFLVFFSTSKLQWLQHIRCAFIYISQNWSRALYFYLFIYKKRLLLILKWV